MKDQEINTAIAKELNFLDVKKDGTIWEVPPSWKVFCNNRQMIVTYWLPDFAKDLNAMHEAEAALKPEQRIKRVQQLCIICDRDYGGELMPSDVMSPIEMTSMFLDCTARQRAEAFLRTLGKWKE